MSWLNTNYILRAGVLSVLLLLPGLMSATCKRDTIINNYKDDSLRFIIKDDSIITFRNGESSFTIIKADSVLPATPKHTKHTRYDNRVHRFRRNWERIIPTHSKIQYAGNMGLLSFGTGWDYGKRNQWETDVLLGFIPKYSSKKAKVTMTLKQNYMPWSINIGKRILDRASCLWSLCEYRIWKSVLGERTGTLSERVLWFLKQSAFPCLYGTTPDL
jgi:hypothetical protein